MMYWCFQRLRTGTYGKEFGVRDEGLGPGELLTCLGIRLHV